MAGQDKDSNRRIHGIDENNLRRFGDAKFDGTARLPQHFSHWLIQISWLTVQKLGNAEIAECQSAL